MATKTISGTNQSDSIDTHKLNGLHIGYDGFVVYGEGGDDNLYSTFWGRDGVDSIYGGDGNDLLIASVADSSFASALFSGGRGIDVLSIGNDHTVISGPERVTGGWQHTAFKISDKEDGSIMSVAVGDDVEYIDIEGEGDNSYYYLTEDLAADRLRAVPWAEVIWRTSGENSDWFLNGLDTYTKLWGEHLGKEGTAELISATTWSEQIIINRVIVGTDNEGILQAKQLDKSSWSSPTGSSINGTASDNVIRGLAGWDALYGNWGNDLVHGGNGRDIINGGLGIDELHGDFGWNTYLSEKDGYVDLIAIKSDQFLNNWWYGTSGNSPNGEKADIIEGLDSNDQIKIIGVSTSDLSFKSGVSHKGVSGIGIYAKGVLEALYTGGDLSASQISSMTTGDSSPQAMANQIWSYWGDNTVPPLQT